MSRRSALALGLSLVLGSLTTLATTAVGQGRPGVRVHFATLHTGGGLEGSAFLVASSRRTTTERMSRSGCSGLTEVRTTVRNPRAELRELTISLRAARASTLTVRETPCEGASFEATWADGTTLRGGDGEVQVSQWTPTPDGRVVATFRWTTVRDGNPFPVRGEINLPMPPAR